MLDLFVEAFGGDFVEFGEIRIKNDLLPANRVNGNVHGCVSMQEVFTDWRSEPKTVSVLEG